MEHDAEKRLRYIQEKFQERFERLQEQLLASEASYKGKSPSKRGKTSATSSTRTLRRAVNSLELNQSAPSDSFEQISEPEPIASTSRTRLGGTNDSLERLSDSRDSRFGAGRYTNDSFERASFYSADGLPVLKDTETVTVYLKKVELTLNGAPVDMLEDRQTEGLE